MHSFSKKMLQKSIFPYLKEYLNGGDSHAPISINLDLTSACSNRCDYCIDKRVLNTGRQLDFAYIKEILGDWQKRGLKSVIVIGGGEPTLHRQFEDIIEFIKGFSLQVGIVSNGTGIEKIENISHLLQGKDWVRFSLDAASEETFQALHHPQIKITLDKILNIVRAIKSRHPKLNIGYSFLIIGDGHKVHNMPLLNNINEIAAAAKLAKAYKFSYLALKPIITPGALRNVEIEKNNLREIKQEIAKARKFETHNFKVVESINLSCFYDRNLRKAMQKQPKTCHAQFFRSVVNPNGIFACTSWRGFDELKISEKYDADFAQKRKAVAQNLNVQESCKNVPCIYAAMNCWIEELMRSPQKVKNLKPIKDFGDFFL